MPKYFFVVQGPDRRRIEDESGVLLLDRRAALIYAHELIDDLKIDQGFDYAGWQLIVTEELGQVVCSFPLAE